jgi:hypothetical protein
MENIIYLKNKITGDVKTLKGGKFNMDLFLLGVLYLFKEGDIKNGVTLLLVISIPMFTILMYVPNIIFAGLLYSLFVLYITAKDYNKVRTEELVKEGYEIINE